MWCVRAASLGRRAVALARPVLPQSSATRLCRWSHVGTVPRTVGRARTSLVAAFDEVTPSAASPPAANFGWATFRSPCELHTLAEETIVEGKALVDSLLAQPVGSIRILEILDDLSDLLCRVADPATYIRQLHPRPEMQDAAMHVAQTIGTFIEELNTHTPLYRHLKSVKEGPEFGSCTVEERRTTIQLLHDFEKSGISLPEDKQRQVVALCERIQQLEFAFESRMLELGATLSGSVGGRVNPMNVQRVLQSLSDPNTRRAVFDAAYQPVPDHLAILDAMLMARHELATLVGYDSFAQKELEHNMVSSPDDVQYFLNEFWKGLQPKIQTEVAALKAAREQHEPALSNDTMWSHDRHYYARLARQTGVFGVSHAHDSFCEYFSVGACFEGINLVVKSVFGVTLTRMTPAQGEVWHPSVQKLVVEHDTEGVLGVIYCDMYARERKSDGAAHYSVLNSREVRDANGNRTSFQLPIVVLTCSFQPPTKFKPSLLWLNEVETLFHEFGHALHSMFGRTRFQTVAGTRCPLDFVELPSQLFEMYVRDYRVVSQFATHHRTGEPIPESIFRNALEEEGRFIGLTAVDSVIQSMTDQLYHAKDPLKVSTTETLMQVQQRFNPLAFGETALQLRYGHLCGYAAAYYSYLWCQALASMIWNQCFLDDPLSRASGDLLRTHVLAHGNAREPWDMVTDLLGYRPTLDEVVKGAIGRWDIH
eukprot:m.174753 g.174753  ORF g.174753 m.174753 type:complete len:708 (+) comp13871_c0_seq1:138-2261(+)